MQNGGKTVKVTPSPRPRREARLHVLWCLPEGFLCINFTTMAPYCKSCSLSGFFHLTTASSASVAINTHPLHPSQWPGVLHCLDLATVCPIRLPLKGTVLVRVPLSV